MYADVPERHLPRSRLEPQQHRYVPLHHFNLVLTCLINIFVFFLTLKPEVKIMLIFLDSKGVLVLSKRNYAKSFVA